MKQGRKEIGFTISTLCNRSPIQGYTYPYILQVTPVDYVSHTCPMYLQLLHTALLQYSVHTDNILMVVITHETLIHQHHTMQ